MEMADLQMSNCSEVSLSKATIYILESDAAIAIQCDKCRSLDA